MTGFPSQFDVLIVGGGIAGASLGAEIAGKKSVLIVEAESHCGLHATGRSAAFWLESYGGPVVAQLTHASHAFLADPPAEFSDRAFLRTRGAVHLALEGEPEPLIGTAGRRLNREQLEQIVPGIRPHWRHGVLEPSCADIDVAGLHAAFLHAFRHCGGIVRTDSALKSARRHGSAWQVELANGESVGAGIIVDAAGAWADSVAETCGVAPLGIAPKRRTMVQLRVGQGGLRDLPLVDDFAGTFYFKGEGDCSVWLSPHDEIATEPCDAAPDELDVAISIERFQKVVDWPVEAVERRWAGLRSFAPDRVPVYGFDPIEPAFFWCVGQGGFGIQTSPAAAKLAASLLLDDRPDSIVAHIDPTPFEASRLA